MDDEESVSPEKGGGNAGKELANKAADKVGDKLKDKALKNAGKNVAVKGKLAAAMGPVIFWGAIIIAAIIIIIGIIMFFMTMPGMVMDKIKALFGELGNYVAAFFGADTTKQIDEENIYSTLDYLEEMGYDIKGFGFLTGYYKKGEEEEIEKSLTSEEISNGYHVDEKVGVVRDDDDHILLAKSDYIFAYVASDNYIYTLKNYNIATLNSSWDSFWDFVTGIVEAVTTASYKFNNFLFGPIYDFLGITDAVQDAWGTGLIALYYEDGGVGKRGNAVNTETLWNHDTVQIDMKSKQLIIAKNELFNTNAPMKYSLDGWTGRYGMPVEFLMSVHVATMMPDLAYNIATGFSTNVNLYLRTSEGTVRSFYKTDSGNVDYSEVSGLNTSNGFDFAKIVSLGLVPSSHGSGCTCSLTKKSRNPWSPEEDYYEVIDPTCKSYADKAISTMASSYDSSYKTYIPYIASVSNHWYRDVYYVIDLNREEDKNVELVTYDYDYETLVKERWSLYETYSAAEDLTKANEFKLYVTNPDGSYSNTGDLTTYYDGISRDKLSLDTVYTDLYLFDGTKEEANDLGYIVSKKAVTIKLTDENLKEELEDLSWNLKNNVWSAYKSTEDSYTGPEEQAKPDSDDDAEGSVYTQVVLTSGTIKQTGEAQRAETNHKIKEMFLSNTYFRYDGTQETAETITKMRDKIKETKLGKKGIAYGPLNALYDDSGNLVDVTDYKFSASDLGYSGDGYKIKVIDEQGHVVEKEKEFKVKDYSGQVSINQDSLNAFSMLENTHTLDADYIYRDFKELVVELGYFTKEELTDEVPKLLEWIVPDIGSAGYPERTIDKRENEYGTMVHSKGDIDANKQYTLKTLLKQLGEGEEEEVNSESEFDFVDEDSQEQVTNKGGKLKPDDFFTDEDIEAHPELTGGSSANDFVDKAKEIWEEMSSLGYDYCVGRRADKCSNCTEACKANAASTDTGACTCECETIHCNHNVNHNPCGLSTKFEKSKENKSSQNVCCATFVSWTLIEMGIDVPAIMKEINGNMHGAYSVSRMCVEYLGAEIITDYEDLEPGDVMAYVRKGKSSITHVDILGEQSGENFTKYNGGHSIPVNSNPDAFTKTKFDSNELCFGMRLFGAYTKNAYVGYNGNETVVSPVTGVLLEYGTYNPNKEKNVDWDTVEDVGYRLNVDLKYGPLVQDADSDFETQSVSDKVGYAKILVLDTEYYQALEMSTENRWNPLKKGTSLVNPNGTYREELIDDEESSADDKLKKDGWTDTEQMVYGYKEFAESYEKGGIAGYILYIDGFVCEIPDKSIAKNTAAAATIPYENNEDEKKKARISTDDITDDLVGYSYKVMTPDNFTNRKIQLKSLYREDDEYKTASEKATNKYKAEIKVKAKAPNSMYLSKDVSEKAILDEKGNIIDKEPIIFIKEGTILGRTMTDKELAEAEQFRNSEYGTYKDNKPKSVGKDKDAEDKILGNYLRIMMRDLDGTMVENVEDYMKLDYIDELDWFELFYWAPFESGGCDLPNCGPECVSSCTPGEVGVGLVQETDTVEPYHPGGAGGGISGFFTRCIEADPVLCAPLKAFTGWGGKDTWCDISGDPGIYFEPCIKYENGEFVSCRYGNDTSKDWKNECYKNIPKSNIQKALKAICNVDREAFLKIQMADAKEVYLDPILAEVPWLADRPECVQGAVMHLHVWGARWRWVADYKDKSDEEILLEVRNVIATTSSTAADASNNPSAGRAWNEPEIGLGILDGKLTRFDVEDWVRSKDYDILKGAGVEIR